MTFGFKDIIIKCKHFSKLIWIRITHLTVNHASCACVVSLEVTSICLKLVNSVALQVYQLLAEPFDTHERQLSALSESGDQNWGTIARWDPICRQCGSTGVKMTFIAKTFYDLRAKTLEGDTVDFNVFRGRVVLIENVASLWGTTTRDFSELNQLQSKYPHRLVVLGFPCNQFGYQVSWTALLAVALQYAICI